jgi:hypothetical protein
VTGVRISEALNLQAQGVDWCEGVLTIHGTKFGKARLASLQYQNVSANGGAFVVIVLTLPNCVTQLFARSHGKQNQKAVAGQFRCSCVKNAVTAGRRVSRGRGLSS